MTTVTEYSFSVSDDTANGDVALGKLQDEIVANSAIVTAPSYLEVDGDSLSVFMKDELSVDEINALTYVVGQHDGVPVSDPVADITELGSMKVSRTYSIYEEDAAFRGILVEAEPGTTEILDIPITTELFFDKGYAWVVGGNVGDYVELSAIDKDDLLGLFSTYGLEVGVDVLELDKFVESAYLKPGMSPLELGTDDVAPVANGLYLRAKLVNVGPESVALGVVYTWFHGE